MSDPTATTTSVVEFMNVISNLGGLGAMVVYFVVRDKRQAEVQQRRDEALSAQSLEREKKLSDRLSSVEDFQRTELSGLVRETVKVVSENTTVLNRVGNALTLIKQKP
jgi:hypothetical protein